MKIFYNGKIFEETKVDRVCIYEASILYLKNKQWIQVNFNETIPISTELIFDQPHMGGPDDQVGSTKLYSAANPVSGRHITICDIQNTSRREFGYLGESSTKLPSPLKISSKIYSYENGKTTIFQPVTIENRIHLMSHVKAIFVFFIG